MTGCVCPASFNTSKTAIYASESVEFWNDSLGATTYEWNFARGEPSSSSEKNPPKIKYNIPGNYDVSLIINKGSDKEVSKTFKNYIQVTQKTDENGHFEAPKANLTSFTNVILQQNFDEANEHLSSGWSVENLGTSKVKWDQGNYPLGDFGTIDPMNKFSAHVEMEMDMKKRIDTKIKSPEIVIPKAAVIEFYALYNAGDMLNDTLSFNISADKGKTWTTYMSSRDERVLPEKKWRKHTFDLSEYEGKEVCFCWHYHHELKSDLSEICRAGDVSLDGVRIFSTNTDPNTPGSIKAGEQIQFTDISSGPPVTWKWSFPGGIPALGTKNP